LVGILLAFGIDATWDLRKQRAETRDALVAVRGELESNLAQIEIDIAFVESVIDETWGFLETVAGSEASPTYEETAHMVSRVTPSQPQSLAQSALNDLVSSGGFGQIESGSLRRALSEYQRLLRLDETESEELRSHFRDRIDQYNISEGSHAVLNWEGYAEVAESSSDFPLPIEAFATNRVYANLLTVRMLTYADVRASRRRLAGQIEEVLTVMGGAF
jgi:hypothetical protein